jgi:hypothetical protein
MGNGFTALENLDDDVDITRAWETFRENISQERVGYYELERHEPSLNEGC